MGEFICNTSIRSKSMKHGKPRLNELNLFYTSAPLAPLAPLTPYLSMFFEWRREWRYISAPHGVTVLRSDSLRLLVALASTSQ